MILINYELDYSIFWCFYDIIYNVIEMILPGKEQLMEIRQIRYAEAIAHCGNFSEAAARLFVTQPTLSQQIRKLEEETGFALFERTTRSVRVTEKGEAFLQHAMPLLEAYDKLQRMLSELRGTEGITLRIGVLPTFAHLNLLELIDRFQAQREGISASLRIHQSVTLLDMLERRELDVIVASMFGEQETRLAPGMEIRILFKDMIHAVLNRNSRLSGEDSISLANLGSVPVVMPGRESSVRLHMDAAFRKAGIHPAAVYECPDIHSMIGMIRSDAGVGFLSSRVAAQYTDDRILSLPLTSPIPALTAVLYRKDDPNMDLLAAFSDLLQRSVRGDRSRGDTEN